MMAALSAFHFERPAWLVLLLPMFALFLAQRRLSDAAERWRGVIDAGLLKHLLADDGRPARLSPNLLLLAAWTVGAVAVAGPAWEREPSPFADERPGVVVVMKVTPSMMTADLAPTRLDRARQKLSDLLAAREGAAAGLVAYAGSSHLVLPPTPDANVVVDLSKALSPAIMPKEGDDLAGAVALADRVLSGDERGGSILVMADTVAGDQIGRLSEARTTHAATVLALLPPDIDPGGLADAARALDADLVATTPDSADVATLARQLDHGGESKAAAADESRPWREAGYWLTPLLALLALGWFRRGWVLA